MKSRHSTRSPATSAPTQSVCLDLDELPHIPTNRHRPLRRQSGELRPHILIDKDPQRPRHRTRFTLTRPATAPGCRQPRSIVRPDKYNLSNNQLAELPPKPPSPPFRINLEHHPRPVVNAQFHHLTSTHTITLGVRLHRPRPFTSQRPLSATQTRLRIAGTKMQTLQLSKQTAATLKQRLQLIDQHPLGTDLLAKPLKPLRGGTDLVNQPTLTELALQGLHTQLIRIWYPLKPVAAHDRSPDCHDCPTRQPPPPSAQHASLCHNLTTSRSATVDDTNSQTALHSKWRNAMRALMSRTATTARNTTRSERAEKVRARP